MSLVLAGIVVLASVSTVVAFKGWPGTTTQARDTPAAMLADAGTPQAAERVSSRVALVVPDAPAPGRVETDREPARRSATAGPTTSTREPAVTSTGTAASGGGTGAVLPAHTSGGSEPDPVATPPVAKPAAPAVTEVVREVGAGLGSTLDNTVSDVGTTLDPVSPTLGQTVDDVGQVVGDTVQGITNTVSDVLDGVLPPR